MTLKCKPPFSVNGNIIWTANEKIIQQNGKYSISPDGSSLTVKKVDEKDKGESHVSFSYQ